MLCCSAGSVLSFSMYRVAQCAAKPRSTDLAWPAQLKANNQHYTTCLWWVPALVWQPPGGAAWAEVDLKCSAASWTAFPVRPGTVSWDIHRTISTCTGNLLLAAVQTVAACSNQRTVYLWKNRAGDLQAEQPKHLAMQHHWLTCSNAASHEAAPWDEARRGGQRQRRSTLRASCKAVIILPATVAVNLD